MRPTLKEIKKYRALIESEWQDEDGYWIALIPGYMDGTNPWCHTIHEYTMEAAYDTLKFAKACDRPEQ